MDFDRECHGTASLEEGDAKRLELLEKNADQWTRAWHASVDKTRKRTFLAAKCREHALEPMEREILIALILNQLGLLERSIDKCSDVLNALCVSGSDSLKVLRFLSEEARLASVGLIHHGDKDEEINERKVFVSPEIIERVLRGKPLKKVDASPKGWQVSSERAIYPMLRIVTRSFYKKADAVEDSIREWEENPSVLYRAARRADRYMDILEATLKLNTGWNLSSYLLRRWHLKWKERVMVVCLLGKELGHLEGDSLLYKGEGLAMATGTTEEDVNENLELLTPDARLLKRDIIRPCDGNDAHLSAQPKDLRETYFELTDTAVECLELDKHHGLRRKGRMSVRRARVSLDRLVLTRKVREALEMAGAQARNAGVLVDGWGLGEVIPYGRAITLLFSGPPGVGKTACAEALATELDRPILVVNYAEIQNCFVGGTEKNIVRVFKEARSSKAVLFWDEADAMFYDRDASTRTWEVRDVNVLLQELEKFEGVCILATNRKVTLDRALARRVSLKVEFERPDKAQRRAIWAMHLPEKMPLADNVDLDELARADLTGGEIKNVVINAARMAVCRNPGKGPVTMEDFRKAVDMETRGKWGDGNRGRIGF